MLEQILDTSAIDLKNSQIKYELDIDLERFEKYKHENIPQGANSYTLKVEPSQVTYSSLLCRFRFEIQYGISEKNKEFKPIDKPIKTQSECLPFR